MLFKYKKILFTFIDQHTHHKMHGMRVVNGQNHPLSVLYSGSLK